MYTSQNILTILGFAFNWTFIHLDTFHADYVAFNTWHKS